MDTSPIDLFILARPGKPQLLQATMESASKVIPSPRRIVVVGQDGEAGYLDGRGVVGFAPGDIPILKTLPAEGRERCFRQFLKWALSKVSQCPSYVVLDAGTTLTSTRTMTDGPRYILQRDQYLHFAEWRMHNWLFGMYPLPGGRFVLPSMVFDASIVTEMLALIEKRYRVRWYDAVLNILNQVPNTRYCAVQAYGGYLENFHRNRLRILPETSRIPDSDMSPAAAEADPPVLRMSTLGVNGRFGNQIFQYGFLRLFAQEHGMEAQNPPWIGTSLFGHQERCSDEPLPVWCELNATLPNEMNHCGHRPASHELWGYFQQHTSYYRSRQAAFRALFQPLESIRTPLEQVIARMRGQGKTLVGIHVRRGDHDGGEFWSTPSEWYLRWLQQVWPTLDQPVLFVASDDAAKVVGDFARFSPKTAADLGIKLNGAAYYADFYALSRCDLLATSNSTFSFAAAMLNVRASCFMRPDPNLQGLTQFDPWNSQVLLSPTKQAA